MSIVIKYFQSAVLLIILIIGCFTATASATEQLLSESEDSDYRVLWAIIPNSDITYNGSKKLTASITKQQVDKLKSIGNDFASRITELSDGNAKLQVTIMICEEPLKSASEVWQDSYWVNQDDLPNSIKKTAVDYDCIIATAMLTSNEAELGNDYWGLTYTSPVTMVAEETCSTISYNCSYSFIQFLPELYLSQTYPEEVYVHEWIHTLENNVVDEYCKIPSADGAETYGYSKTQDDSWYSYYGDILKGKVKDPKNGELLGMTKEAWKNLNVSNYYSKYEHHDWDNGKTTRSASCTIEGEKTYTCRQCNTSRVESIPKTDHTYEKTLISPTCTDDGYTLYKCTVCNNQYTSNSRKALGHDYYLLSDSHTNCEVESQQTFKCSRCNSIDERIIPAKPHSWDEGTIVIAPSLGKNGEIEYRCTICASIKKEVIESDLSLYTPVVTGQNISSGIKLSWKEISGADGYRIYRNDELLQTVNSDQLYFTDTRVSNGKSYSYEISAFKGNIESYSYNVDYLFLSKPVISSVSNTSSGLSLKWDENKKASGYYIYRSVNDGSYKQVKIISDYSEHTWTDTDVKNGTKYKYKIKAYKSTKNGTYNSTYSAIKTYYRFSRPSISSLTNTSSGKLKVCWNKNSKVNGYQIRYSLYSDFSTYKTITITDNSTISKTISNLKKSKKYYVKVRSYGIRNDKKYYSYWSAKKSITITK